MLLCFAMEINYQTPAPSSPPWSIYLFRSLVWSLHICNPFVVRKLGPLLVSQSHHSDIMCVVHIYKLAALARTFCLLCIYMQNKRREDCHHEFSIIDLAGACVCGLNCQRRFTIIICCTHPPPPVVRGLVTTEIQRPMNDITLVEVVDEEI